MLSRILWVALAGVALIGGIIYQNGPSISFGLGDDIRRERAIEASVERTIENRIADHITVAGADGRTLDVSRETKTQLGKAVSELVAAKTELAFLRARNAKAADVQAAERRSDRAEAEVTRLKEQIDEQKQLSRSERDALRTQIQQDVRQAIRDTVRG